MRLLVNAVGLRAGGGLTVGLNCLQGIRESRPQHELMALVPADCGYEERCRELSITYRAFRTTASYQAWRLWFDQVHVPIAARRWSADVLLTMNNQAALAAPCPQILLFHNPYYIYPVAEWWPLLSMFGRASLLLQRGMFAVNARRCARIAVQTPVASSRLEQQYGIPADRLHIVPNAIALEHDGTETEAGRLLARRMRAAARGRIVVLTLARYYPHKDLELVVRVAQKLREAGDRRFVFFITIAAGQHSGARALIETIARHQLSDDVVNLGPLDFCELGGAYDATAIALLPSVLESMSGTHLEAMHYGVPIVTADRDFAREVCGPAALYFPPGNVEAAMNCLRAVSPGRHRAGSAARPRSWRDVAGDLAALIDSVHRSGGEVRELVGVTPPTR